MKLIHFHRKAKQLLREDQNKLRKLVLIHTAVTCGLSLLLMITNHVSQSIVPDEGLSTMKAQITLATWQTMLQLATVIIIPFWNAGLFFCALKLIQNQDHTPSSLLEGFRRWKPVASATLIRSVTYFAMIFLCAIASGLWISTRPMPMDLQNELIAAMEDPTLPRTGGAQKIMVGYVIIYIFFLLILLVPKLYAHRLTDFRIMDKEPCRGLDAIMYSSSLMKDNYKQLLLLDLSFWWFYLLEVAIGVLSTASVFFPGGWTAIPYADWIFPIAALVAQLVLYLFAKPKLAVSYALFYQHVSAGNQQEPASASVNHTA